MTQATSSSVQSGLLTAGQLFTTALQLIRTEPSAEYPHREGRNHERAWCTWSWRDHEGVAFTGDILVTMSADASAAISGLMRPNRISITQHIGTSCRITFRIRENDPVFCRPQPPENFVRLMDRLRLEDAFEIE